MILVAFERSELSTIWDLAVNYLLERWNGGTNPPTGKLVSADTCEFCEGNYCDDCDNPEAKTIVSCQEILMSLQMTEFYR